MNSAPLDPQHIINHPNSEKLGLGVKIACEDTAKTSFFLLAVNVLILLFSFILNSRFAEN